MFSARVGYYLSLFNCTRAALKQSTVCKSAGTGAACKDAVDKTSVQRFVKMAPRKKEEAYALGETADSAVETHDVKTEYGKGFFFLSNDQGDSLYVSNFQRVADKLVAEVILWACRQSCRIVCYLQSGQAGEFQ